MVEISEEKYWKLLNYYDGMLYLSLLTIDGKNDWRMFKYWLEGAKFNGDIKDWGMMWYAEDANCSEDDLINKQYLVVPVRDV
jgi:hypothetical protein